MAQLLFLTWALSEWVFIHRLLSKCEFNWSVQGLEYVESYKKRDKLEDRVKNFTRNTHEQVQKCGDNIQKEQRTNIQKMSVQMSHIAGSFNGLLVVKKKTLADSKWNADNMKQSKQ